MTGGAYGVELARDACGCNEAGSIIGLWATNNDTEVGVWVQKDIVEGDWKGGREGGVGAGKEERDGFKRVNLKSRTRLKESESA